MIKSAFLYDLPVEVQKDKFCLEVIPLKETNSQSKDILVKLFGTHNFENVVIFAILQTLLQVLRIMLKLKAGWVDQNLASADGCHDQTYHCLLHSDTFWISRQMLEKITNETLFFFLVSC